MAFLQSYTFDSSEKILRINTDEVQGVQRDIQAIGVHLICASITGSGNMTVEQGNTDDESQAVAVNIVDPADGSTTAVVQAISTGNFFVSFYGADACKNIYLRFPATLTGGTCAIHGNLDFTVVDDS